MPSDDYHPRPTKLSSLQTIAELDALLLRFPTNEAMREAVYALGVSWTFWDADENGWLAFVQRLRGWLVESLSGDAK